MDIVALAAGLVSVNLAIVATWQAMYFYSKGKDAQSRAEAALVGIKAQVDTLQTVNAKITERLARYAAIPAHEVRVLYDLCGRTSPRAI